MEKSIIVKMGNSTVGIQAGSLFMIGDGQVHGMMVSSPEFLFIFIYSMIEFMDTLFLKLRKKKTNLRKWKEEDV
jgi:hypothetical protein